MEARSLSRADVPRASLNGRKPEQLKIPELKLWLAFRKVTTKGRKEGRSREKVQMDFHMFSIDHYSYNVSLHC